jgi:pimeloyl-ACP methyl ester carboxylesterase
VTACAKYLSKERNYKKNPLGIIGHSEGGMHAFLALSEYPKIDFLIQLATAGTSGEEVLLQQQYDIPKASKQSDDLCTWNRDVFAGMAQIVLELPRDVAADSLQTFLSNAYESAPRDFDTTAQTKAQFILGYNAFMNNEWMRQFLMFRTRDYLKKTDVPILAIHGSRDIQVAAEANSAPFKQYKNGTAYILNNLNHLLQPCNTCDISEYGTIETTIAPEVLHLMTDWLLRLEEQF